MNRYPELIPMSYELGKVNLVNLAEKYNNEPDNIEKKTTEGCYEITKQELKDKFKNYKFSDDIDNIQKKRMELNDETLKVGNNYFAMKENSEDKGFYVDRELEEILDRSPKSNDAKNVILQTE